MIYMRIWYW